MKKTMLSLLVTVVTICLSAQAPTNRILTDTVVTNNSISASIFALNGSQQWHGKLKVQMVGTNDWIYGDTVTTVFPTTPVRSTVHMLQGDTLYKVKTVAYNQNYTDSLEGVDSLLIRTRPNAQPVFISHIDSLPALPKSGILFSGSAVGDTSRVYGRSSMTGAVVTDTVVITGVQADTVYFLTNTPGQLTPPTFLVIESIGGGSSNYSSTLPSFRIPNYVAPDFTLVSPFKTKDSISVLISGISLGNTGPITFTSTTYDLLTNAVVAQSSQVTTTTQSMRVGKGNLMTNRNYKIVVTAIGGQALFKKDSIIIKTDQVTAPTVVVTLVNPTNPYEVRALVTATESYDSSRITEARFYENSVLVKTDTLSVVDTITLIWLRQALLGTTYQNQIVVKNLAGLTGTVSFNVIIPAATPNGAPTIATTTQESPSRQLIEGVTAHPAQGNTSIILLETQKMSDATIRYDFVGANLTGLVGNVMLYDLEGNNQYRTRAVDTANGIWVPGQWHYFRTITPIGVKVSNIVQNNVTGNSISVSVKGTCDGLVSDIILSIYEGSFKLGDDFVASAGSDTISFPFTFTDLSPLTTYKIQAVLRPRNGNYPSATRSDYFSTNSVTGIEEVAVSNYQLEHDPETKILGTFDLLGQKVSDNPKVKGIYIIQFQNRDKIWTRKAFF